MTGDIISLRLARKCRLRDEKEKEAAVNRAKHGRAKSERQAARAAQTQSEKRLDAHKRED